MATVKVLKDCKFVRNGCDENLKAGATASIPFLAFRELSATGHVESVQPKSTPSPKVDELAAIKKRVAELEQENAAFKAAKK